MDPKPASHGPAAPVAILASSRSNTLARVADIDETTLRRFVAEAERQRRREQKLLALGAAVPYLPFLVLPHPIVALGATAIAAVTVGAAFGVNRVVRRAFHEDADQYGLTPELSRDLSRRVRTVAGYVPRWVKGQDRVAAIAAKLREG